MRVPLFQIDAFASEPFSGNPAAVVLLDADLPDALLQAVAAENNLSETAFVVGSAPPYRLRWFTPTQEIDLCGHATLASAFVIFEQGRVESGSVRFLTASGALTVTRADGFLSMDFPARPPVPAACTDALVEALGKRPREVHVARDLLAVLGSESEVASLEPNVPALAALDAFAVIVTARGDEVDFVSRFFAPKAGVPEDPVTGSAHCTLAPFWSSRLGKRRLVARQLSKRGGTVWCEDRGDRVELRGRAVEYLRGEIRLDVDRGRWGQASA